MHDVTVRMKDGQQFEGPLWIWRPLEGWFELAGQDQRFYLKDVESAMESGVRTSRTKVEDVDLLHRARQDGWVEPR